ncbi:unnamed protein product [Adineta steineri]|uniref:Uncharacterized protein n=1 Tax=Adineta steineri TaxID=433720 RepID=A0A818RAH8_9BILA|nr:unnamed protein product [Adineta steineri]CAF3650682.1 unnamed protein product [Adineta steineri]
MIKIFIFATLIYVAIASGRDMRSMRKFPSNPMMRRGPTVAVDDWSSTLCDNGTSAAAFLSETQKMITSLEANPSYNNVLQDHAQTITFLKSGTNANILSSNCSEYFQLFQNAQNLDQIAQQQQLAYENNIDNLFRKVLNSVAGVRVSANVNF